MKHRNRERGVTIPMVAMFIVVLFAMAALAVDLGVLYSARTSAQHAADAAALAGAYTFALNPTAPQPSTATAAAIAVAGKSNVLGTAVTITTGDVVVDTANRRVRVTVPRTGANGIQTFFAKVIGMNRVDVQTTALAEASRTADKSECLKPIFIPNTVLSTNPNPAAACAAGQRLFNADGSLSTYANSNMTPTSLINLTPSTPQDAWAPSQFYGLDFGNSVIGHGADPYRCTLGSCLNECGVDASKVACGGLADVKTGGMIGPTNQGINNLIGNPPDTFAGKYNGEWTFHPGGDTSIFSETSRSLGVAPVWDDCDPVTMNNLSSGTKHTLKIIGFLELFVDGMQGKAVKARLIRPIACNASGGAGGAGGSLTGTGPLGIPVRLVNAAP